MSLRSWTIILLFFAAASAEAITVYLTDLEGSRRKLHQFYRDSGAFGLGSDGKYHVREGYLFVYGGDAPDRFLGSLEVVEELARLASENNRTILIAGNRDINKLRFHPELSPAALTVAPADPRWPGWTRQQLGDLSDTELLARDTRVLRLRWMLSMTMGSPDAFELRKQELGQRAQRAVSDDEVVDSFLRETGPGGAFETLLDHARLAYRDGETLFLHSGVTLENIGLIPDGTGRRIASADAWIGELNGWYANRLAVWKASRDEWSGRGPRPAEDLLMYPMPLRPGVARMDSVVTGRYLDSHGVPCLPPAEILAQLKAWGILRLVVGHTPVGAIPLVLRTEDGSFEMIVADNSHSQELPSIVTLNREQTRIQSQLIQPGGLLAVDFSLTLGTPSAVGRTLSDGRRVVAPATGGMYFTFTYEPRYEARYETVSCAALVVPPGPV